MEQTETIRSDGMDAPVTARHRKWWRGVGNGAMVLLVFLGFSLMADLVSGWYTGSQPIEEMIRHAILRISVAWVAAEFLAQWGMLLKSYCFARAETVERIKLFDHLRTAPVRQRIVKQAYIDARVLAVLLCLFSISSLCFLLRSLF